MSSELVVCVICQKETDKHHLYLYMDPAHPGGVVLICENCYNERKESEKD